MVAKEPFETPAAAMDARETLIQQQNELEMQRREIEDLRRQLKLKHSDGMLTPPDNESLGELYEAIKATPPRKPANKRKVADRNSNQNEDEPIILSDTAARLMHVPSDAEGAMAEMDAVHAQIGAMAAMHSQKGMVCTTQEVGLMNVEDVIDEMNEDEFGPQISHNQKLSQGHKSATSMWSGLPHATANESVIALGGSLSVVP
jgi:hypothetical protein